LSATKKPAPSKFDLEKKVKQYARVKALAKRNYDRSDRLLVEIAAALPVGEEMPIGNSGKKVLLMDNYAGKNIVWGHGGVRRWDLDIIEP
jgi:hypothetical protein